MDNFFVGLDLGQAQDYTAVVILEKLKRSGEQSRYQVRHLERLQLGTPYPVIVEHVDSIVKSPQISDKARLIVDATGVGAPVVDMFRKAGLDPVAITITSGDTVSGDDHDGYRIPKRDLVSILQVLFQSSRLKIAESLPMAKVLLDELLNFKVRINIKTAHDSYQAWREGVHDDLVLALALAAWYGADETVKRRNVFRIG